jgi:hypothetical protein
MESCETWQRSCPPQGAGTFAYFCCRAKVWRLAVRVLPVLTLTLKILLPHKKIRATDLQSVAQKKRPNNPPLLIPIKQPHLIKTMLLHLEGQWEITRALHQQIGRGLLASPQTFVAEQID